MPKVSFLRLRAIFKKEFRQLGRDVRSLIFLLAMPGFLLLMFGFALNFDVKHVTLAVCDQDRTPASREFIGSFVHSEYFDLKYEPDDVRTLERLLGEEKARVALVIPPGMGNEIAARREPSVQVILDGSNAMSASTAVGYVSSVVQEYSLKMTIRLLSDHGFKNLPLPIDNEIRVWYNPELRSANFLVPGLMAFILMTFLVISTAFSIVREKDRGTMEQILVSPVRAAELIVGKTVPYVLLSLVSSHIVLLLGKVLFGVTIKGSYPLLLLAMILFLIGGLGQGLLISSITRTQQVAFQLALLTTYLPTFILSGFVFPIRNMPLIVQAFTYLIPAKDFLIVLRSIILKGAGLEAFWRQIIVLAGFAVLMLTASSLLMVKSSREGSGSRKRGKRP